MKTLDWFLLGWCSIATLCLLVPFCRVGYRYLRAKYSKADLYVTMKDDRGVVVEKFKIDYNGKITPIIERKSSDLDESDLD